MTGREFVIANIVSCPVRPSCERGPWLDGNAVAYRNDQPDRQPIAKVFVNSLQSGFKIGVIANENNLIGKRFRRITISANGDIYIGLFFLEDARWEYLAR